MARLITGEELHGAVEKQTFIKGGDPLSAEGVKYDFHLGPNILKASFGRPINANKLNETEKNNLVIDPGEMVFAFTQERLALPANMFALISHKRKMNHAGILVIGGTSIDPKYEGALLIGLFNFSSSRFPLMPGRKVLAATFYELEGNEQGDFPKPETFEDFPVELIEVMQKYQPSSVPALAQALERLRADVERLTTDLSSHEQWYRRFEESLGRHDSQIGELIRGLTAEKETRGKGEDKLTEAVQEFRNTFNWMKGAAWIIGSILALVVIPLIVAIAYNWLTGK